MNDIEDCQRLGKMDPKNTIVWFVNCKFWYEALDNKLKLRKVDMTKLGFQATNTWLGNAGNSKEQVKFLVVGVPKGLSSWGTISIMHDSNITDLYPDFVFRKGQNQGGNR